VLTTAFEAASYRPVSRTSIQKKLHIARLMPIGITCYAYLDGTPSSYAVWTEWAPAGPVFYNSTNFHVGDVIHARVVAHSENSGTTYLENLSTGEKLETSYSNQTHTLKLGDVEWVVESQLQLTELGPEGSLGARYTPWIFENAEYCTKGKHG
jgi:hypothetical protein